MLNKLYEKVNFSSEELNIIHNYMATSIHSTIQKPIALDSVPIDRLLLLRLKISRFLEVLPSISKDLQQSYQSNSINETYVVIDECFIDSFRNTLKIISLDIEKQNSIADDIVTAL
ncbi:MULTISPECIES: hypothetical protein [Bacillus cereus group]|uniref:hypothetical protein n=1 Tax=Bacillus cereus group TaxID=86661 RepID=UPI000BF8FC06|nr:MULTISPECIES: hypothetical protein [Bacillus cereus group]PFT46188.1 hypothetical protein COK63_05045 [Bacillus cereus]